MAEWAGVILLLDRMVKATYDIESKDMKAKNMNCIVPGRHCIKRESDIE